MLLLRTDKLPEGDGWRDEVKNGPALGTALRRQGLLNSKRNVLLGEFCSSSLTNLNPATFAKLI
jgi:hypothetical protein